MPRSNHHYDSSFRTTLCAFGLLALLVQEVSVNAFSSIIIAASNEGRTKTVAVADPEENQSILLNVAISQDRVSLGNLKVPHVGVGTIAWSSENGAFLPLLRGLPVYSARARLTNQHSFTDSGERTAQRASVTR
jgi:hypothetical protein